MKSLQSLLAILSITLFVAGNAMAADQFLGTWTSGAKEVLNVTESSDGLSAEFIRVNVKSQFEKVRFPAKVKDGALVITGEQGDLSAKIDTDKGLLVLGGVKAFQKLSAQDANALIESLKK